jgi:ferrous iron transport protein B
MKRILLMGNPNVGKSVVFSRLTGTQVIVSNYPGTTVEFTQGRLKLDGELAEVIDVPGAYGLEPTSRAEEVATRMLDEGDLIINVVDATNLERNLNLTLQLLKSGRPILVALNMSDEARHKGIEIAVEKLEELLGVPVVPTCALSGEGINTLMSRLDEARANTLSYDDHTRWTQVGHIVEQVQEITRHHHTLIEKLADFSLRPATGIPLAVLVGFVCFEAIRLIGEGLIGFVFEPLFETYWAPVMMRLSDLLGSGTLWHGVLIGSLVEGKVDFGQSMGLLTTGLFVPIGAVLPYVFAFYLVLSLLEDVGYLPRLSVLVDTVMHRLGLHGLVMIPMLLGLGCNVPGALATRIFDTRRERFVSATLMAICVPCMAQIAMVAGLLGKYGAAGLGPVFGTLALLWVVLALILNRALPGEAPEIFTEIPPYRIPYHRAVAQKVWLRTRQFVSEAIPYVLLGVLIVNALYSLHLIQFLGRLFAPVLTTVLGLPEEAIAALLVGFLRKDVAVGMLAPLGLGLKQLIIACVLLTVYFPCAATFAVLLREFGTRDMLKAMGLMILVALSAGGALNLIL